MRKWLITGGAGFIGCLAAGDGVAPVDPPGRRGEGGNLARVREGRAPFA